MDLRIKWSSLPDACEVTEEAATRRWLNFILDQQFQITAKTNFQQ